MAKARKLMGYKHKLDEPVDWTLRQDKRVVFYRIEVVGDAQTPDGGMLLVRLAHKAELADPSNDIAALVGQATAYRKSGHRDPQSPELWFWNDRFWVKARATDGTAYYNNKCYLLYEVNVRDPDLLLAEITTGFDRPQ